MVDNNKKKHLFSFAKINKYFIFPFLCPVFCFLGNYCIFSIYEDKGIKHPDF